MTPIEKTFTHHTLKDGQSERYTVLRAKAKELAELIELHCPSSREQALAMTNLEQSVMWAETSILKNE